MSVLRAAAAAAMLALVACGGSGDPTVAPPTGTSPPASSRPTSSATTFRIVEPAFGATVEGPSVTVVIELEGATLLEEASRDLRPDTGHVHVALDGTTLTLLAGLTYTIDDVPPGEHIVRAEFAAADHGSFAPRVVSDVRFSVT